jgi:hypothetical protein
MVEAQVSRVLIIGGYGNFGSYIATALAREPSIELLIGGRDAAKASAFAADLNGANPAQGCALDIADDLAGALAGLRPDVVVHTTGPFQSQQHSVARACIAQGCHYIDLADAREFVANIGALDSRARERGVLVVSGASSVPCLTAAIIDHYLPQFARLESADYGISAAQQTNRGLATTSAILSYVGKAFTTLTRGELRQVHGWQGLRNERYPELGRRWFGNCDIPDLALFPQRYPHLRSLRFGAGHEIALLHFGLWLLSWLVRWRGISSLAPHAEPLLRAARWFDRFGSSSSGLHMYLRGIDHMGRGREQRFFLIARSGHGPYIPCMPAIILARKLARGELTQRGALPCLDLISLREYIEALGRFDIGVFEQPTNG